MPPKRVEPMEERSDDKNEEFDSLKKRVEAIEEKLEGIGELKTQMGDMHELLKSLVADRKDHGNSSNPNPNSRSEDEGDVIRAREAKGKGLLMETGGHRGEMGPPAMVGVLWGQSAMEEAWGPTANGEEEWGPTAKGVESIGPMVQGGLWAIQIMRGRSGLPPANGGEPPAMEGKIGVGRMDGEVNGTGGWSIGPGRDHRKGGRGKEAWGSEGDQGEQIGGCGS